MTRAHAWVLVLGLWGCDRASDDDRDPTDTPDPTDTVDTVSPTDTDDPQPTDTEVTDTDATSPVRWMLHGGGPEDDGVFLHFVEAAGFGKIVTLGAVTDTEDPDLLIWDGYFTRIGAAEAVTVNTPDAVSATDTGLADILRTADGIFIRGGDPEPYVSWWFGGPIGVALRDAVAAGAVIGGTAGGAAILGEKVFDGRRGNLAPASALRDGQPFAATFSNGMADVGVRNLLIDTQFTERGRLARLALFLATVNNSGPSFLGVGIDSQTALFVREDGSGYVRGRGSVTLLRADGGAPTLPDDAPPAIPDLTMWQLPTGYDISLTSANPVTARPQWVTAVQSRPVVGSFVDGRVKGDRPFDRMVGTWEIVGLRVSPSAWIDRELSLEAGNGMLPGVVVVPGLLEELRWFENDLGGLMWALAQHPGAVGLGVDLGVEVATAPPARLRPEGDASLVVVDTRGATYAGVPGTGWMTAALERAVLHIVPPGTLLDVPSAP